MTHIMHITSGDIAGEILTKTGLPGEILVWHDILYTGPRKPGWPDDDILKARALFLEETTGGGLSRMDVLKILRDQYQKLLNITADQRIVLWFDACLFDQSMLAHILTCLHHTGCSKVELLCVNSYPGIEPFNGLGQLLPEQLRGLYGTRHSVTSEQFRLASQVDGAFAAQDLATLARIAAMTAAPLPWMPAAVARWLKEQPDPVSGLGRLESLALTALRQGCDTPEKIFTAVAAADTPPQYWGDTTLWAKLNGLADRVPPLIRIDGPAPRLPQWQSEVSLKDFTINIVPE